MIFIDRRIGSKELFAPLRRMGLPVELVELSFGDLAFVGRGANGAPVDIGIEFKRLNECIASIRTARLQGYQVPGMRETYDFCWLLIEGELLYDPQGYLRRRSGRRTLQRLHGNMTIGEWNGRLLGLLLRGGCFPWMTRTRQCSLKWIEALYRTWTDKDFDQHTSHFGIYRAPTLAPANDVQVFLQGLPGVGARVSKAAASHFKSVRRALNATPQEWADLTTTDDHGKARRVGDKDAQRICQFLDTEAT